MRWVQSPHALHPVVLVHGTFENMLKNRTVLSPQLKATGYCVYALNYGNDATEQIAESVKQLGPFRRGVSRRRPTRNGQPAASIVGQAGGGVSSGSPA